MIINNVQMQNLYVVQENLNVRSGPGTSYTIIGGIKQYELVDVKHCLNNFAYIGNGQWISQRYLERYTKDVLLECRLNELEETVLKENCKNYEFDRTIVDEIITDIKDLFKEVE